jgi:hypothetical protein
MAVIIRKRPAATIIRRSRPASWPGLRPGYPLRDNESLFHVISVRGVKFVFLWIPGAPLDQMWSCGMWLASPSVMAQHEYLGVASVVYTTDVRQESYGRARRW